jgi:cbb3-type cytochrome oxidase subunit 3
MAASTGKTVGLILLVIVLIALTWKLTPMILAPLGAFTGAFHFIRIPEMNNINIGPWFPRFATTSVLSAVLFIIWIAIVIWVYRDAERRGMNGILWALLVFIGNLIGLLIYLIVRSDPAKAPPKAAASHPCPQCQQPVAPGFAYCPHCGTALLNVCPECKKPVEQGWQACPHCGHKLK